MEPEKTPTKDTPGGGSRKGLVALVVVGVLGAVAVNIAAFMLSADAITTVAKAAGISSRIAWAMVLSVDGMMLTGTMAFITNKLRSRSVTYPVTVLAAGVLLSIICNALHSKAGGGHVVQLGGHAKMAVSAIPAVSLALSFHLIADMVKDSLGGHTQTVSAGASVAASSERPPERLPEVSVERLPSVSQTPAGSVSQTPAKASLGASPRASAERPKAPRQTPSAKPKQTTRERARELLKTSPDMNAAELARKLGKTPSGTYREMRAEVLAELRDAGEIPSVRALGA